MTFRYVVEVMGQVPRYDGPDAGAAVEALLAVGAEGTADGSEPQVTAEREDGSLDMDERDRIEREADRVLAERDAR